MLLAIVSILIFVVAGVYLWRNMRIPWLANPAVWFVINQILMTGGTLFLLETDLFPQDVVYLFAMFSVMIFFIMGTGMAKAMSSCSSELIERWGTLPVKIESGTNFNIMLIIIIFLSLTISFLYFYTVGYNLFLLGIYSIMSGQDLIEDPATMRLYSYATDVYFAPGYVNQFKNNLLPLSVCYMALRSVLLGRHRGLVVAVLLSPVVIILLLGTGQRGAFVIATICFIIFLLTAFPRMKRRYIILPGVLFVILFMVSSLIIGRGSSELKDASDLLLLFEELFNRVLQGNQHAGLAGFRYFYAMPTAWGAEWLAEVRQMIPGLKDPNYIATSGIIFEILFGSMRGTSPLTLVGSLWLNFHIIGVTLMPLLLGILYQTVYHHLVMGPKTLFRLLIFSAIAGVLGIWSVGGIANLLLNGLAAIVLFYILGEWALRMDEKMRMYNIITAIKHDY